MLLVREKEVVLVEDETTKEKKDVPLTLEVEKTQETDIQNVALVDLDLEKVIAGEVKESESEVESPYVESVVVAEKEEEGTEVDSLITLKTIEEDKENDVDVTIVENKTNTEVDSSEALKVNENEVKECDSETTEFEDTKSKKIQEKDFNKSRKKVGKKTKKKDVIKNASLHMTQDEIQATDPELKNDFCETKKIVDMKEKDVDTESQNSYLTCLGDFETLEIEENILGEELNQEGIQETEAQLRNDCVKTFLENLSENFEPPSMMKYENETLHFRENMKRDGSKRDISLIDGENNCVELKNKESRDVQRKTSIYIENIRVRDACRGKIDSHYRQLKLFCI